MAKGLVLFRTSGYPLRMDCSKEATTRARRERERVLRLELERMTGLLRSRPDIHSVLLFGSLATGTCSPHSDLDLIIVQDTGLGFLERIEALLRYLEPRVAVDLLVYTPVEWTGMAQRGFVRRALKEGQVLHAAAA